MEILCPKPGRERTSDAKAPETCARTRLHHKASLAMHFCWFKLSNVQLLDEFCGFLFARLTKLGQLATVLKLVSRAARPLQPASLC